MRVRRFMCCNNSSRQIFGLQNIFDIPTPTPPQLSVSEWLLVPVCVWECLFLS